MFEPLDQWAVQDPIWEAWAEILIQHRQYLENLTGNWKNTDGAQTEHYKKQYNYSAPFHRSTEVMKLDCIYIYIYAFGILLSKASDLHLSSVNYQLRQG